MDNFNDRIDRYKQEMASLIRDKNKDIDRLRAYTEQMEEETPAFDYGNLIVVVTDEENMAPINGASVMITLVSEKKREELTSFVLTNEFGKTQSIKLLADTDYTVTVSADGYNTLTQTVSVQKDETAEIGVSLIKNDLIYDNGSLALMAGEAAINRFKKKECCVFPMRVGDEGDCICDLQKALANLSRVFDFTAPRPTGKFGQKTSCAIGKIQRVFALPVTYCVDEITWDAIFAANDALNMKVEDDGEARMCVTFPKTRILSYGDKNEDVWFLQLVLVKLSKRFCNITPFCPNGVYDETTQNNVSTLQGILGLPVTGRVGQGTMHSILKIC